MQGKTKLAVLAAVAGLGGYIWWQETQAPAPTVAGGAMVAVTLPKSLSAEAQRGQETFEAKCAACHGTNATGREGGGPPLVHKIYEPSHHGDGAFRVAVSNGVRQHHWSFGNMPPVPSVSPAEVEEIIAYIRALQRANGID